MLYLGKEEMNCLPMSRYTRSCHVEKKEACLVLFSEEASWKWEV